MPSLLEINSENDLNKKFESLNNNNNTNPATIHQNTISSTNVVVNLFNRPPNDHHQEAKKPPLKLADQQQHHPFINNSLASPPDLNITKEQHPYHHHQAQQPQQNNLNSSVACISSGSSINLNILCSSSSCGNEGLSSGSSIGVHANNDDLNLPDKLTINNMIEPISHDNKVHHFMTSSEGLLLPNGCSPVNSILKNSSHGRDTIYSDCAREKSLNENKMSRHEAEISTSSSASTNSEKMKSTAKKLAHKQTKPNKRLMYCANNHRSSRKCGRIVKNRNRLLDFDDDGYHNEDEDNEIETTTVTTKPKLEYSLYKSFGETTPAEVNENKKKLVRDSISIDSSIASLVNDMVAEVANLVESKLSGVESVALERNLIKTLLNDISLLKNDNDGRPSTKVVDILVGNKRVDKAELNGGNIAKSSLQLNLKKNVYHHHHHHSNIEKKSINNKNDVINEGTKNILQIINNEILINKNNDNNNHENNDSDSDSDSRSRNNQKTGSRSSFISSVGIGSKKSKKFNLNSNLDKIKSNYNKRNRKNYEIINNKNSNIEDNMTTASKETTNEDGESEKELEEIETQRNHLNSILLTNNNHHLLHQHQHQHHQQNENRNENENKKKIFKITMNNNNNNDLNKIEKNLNLNFNEKQIYSKNKQPIVEIANFVVDELFDKQKILNQNNYGLLSKGDEVQKEEEEEEVETHRKRVVEDENRVQNREDHFNLEHGGVVFVENNKRKSTKLKLKKRKNKKDALKQKGESFVRNLSPTNSQNELNNEQSSLSDNKNEDDDGCKDDDDDGVDDDNQDDNINDDKFNLNSSNNNENNNFTTLAMNSESMKSNNSNGNTNNNNNVENIFESSLTNEKDLEKLFNNNNNNNNTSNINNNNGDVVILGNKDLNNNKFETSNNSDFPIVNDKSTNITTTNPTTPNNDAILKEDLNSSLSTSSYLINLKQKNYEIGDILEGSNSKTTTTTTTTPPQTTTTNSATHNNDNNSFTSKNNTTNTQTNNFKKPSASKDINQRINTNTNNNNNNGDDDEILKDSSDLIIKKMMKIENEKNKLRINSGESLSSSSVSTNSSFNLNENSTEQLNQDCIGSQLDTTNSSINFITTTTDDQGNNIKKVVLKNNEVVLIEDCIDEDDEDYQRLEKCKSQDSAELFPASNENVMSKSCCFEAPRKTSQPKLSTLPPKQHYAPNFDPQTTPVVNNSDDPYVKAALERFDAFCKSKSTQNLDQTPTMSSPLLSHRQKSPYLTRKTIIKPNDEANLKDNIGSFIKKRHARIDPAFAMRSASNRNDSTNNSSESSDEIKQPTNASCRSVSETRTDGAQFRSLSSDKYRPNKSFSQANSGGNGSISGGTTPLTSSLAKKFLGSLTPQLEPVQINDIKLDETEVLRRPREDPVKAQKLTPSPVTKETSPPSVVHTPGARTTSIVESRENKQRRPAPVTIKSNELQTRNNKNNSINMSKSLNNNETTDNKKHQQPLISSTSSTSSAASSDNSATSSPTHSAKSNKQVNIIKLEVFNSKKQQRPENGNTQTQNGAKHDDKVISCTTNTSSTIEKTVSNSKPPLPPTTTSPLTSTISNTTSPSSWRSKLRSIYSEAPIIDGNKSPTTTSNENSNHQPPSSPNSRNSSGSKPVSRVIPIEIKNSKSGQQQQQHHQQQQQQQQTNKTTSSTNINQISRGSALYSSLKGTEKTSNMGVNILNVNRSQSPQPTTGNTSSISNNAPSVQDRIRSLSTSYREDRLSAENELANRNPTLSQSSTKLREIDSNDNYESIDTRHFRSDKKPDPIAEKACNNFMHKLMEFQRQHQYQSYTTTPISPSISPLITTTTTTTTPTATITPTPTSVSYTGPIVSARVANTSPYLAGTIASAPLYSSVYNQSSTYSPYLYGGSTYDSKFSTIGPSGISATSSYLNNDSDFASSGGSLSHRPYVSAIRKRRTLFSDEFDGSLLSGSNDSNDSFSSINGNNTSYLKERNDLAEKNESSYTTYMSKSSLNTQPSTTNDSILNKNGIGYSHARNRPLSIVNEEAAAANQNHLNNNGGVNLNRSYTFNESQLSKPQNSDVSNGSNSGSINVSKTKPQLKKSNSVNSSSAKPETTKIRPNVFGRHSTVNSTLNVAETQPTCATINSSPSNASNSVTSSLNSTSINQPKSSIKNVNTQIKVENNNNHVQNIQQNQQTPPPPQQQSKKMNGELNTMASKPPPFGIEPSNIKLQNEIAIVTSMIPKKRDIPIVNSALNNNTSNSTTTANGSNSNVQSINRIRSLDSKSREKFRSNVPGSPQANSSTSVKKTQPQQQQSPPSSNFSPTPISPIIQTNLIPSCYLYPTVATNSSSKITANNSNLNTTTSNNNTNHIGAISSSKSSTSIGCSSETSNENGQNGSTSNTSSTAANTEKASNRRKSQTLAVGKLNENSTAKTDVFERLSKRTNSMKNLSNSNNNSGSSINPTPVKSNKTSSSGLSSSDNEKASSSNDEGSNHEDHLFHHRHHNLNNTNNTTNNSNNNNNHHQVASNGVHTNTNHLTNGNSHANHSLSKTSVFERLYKSNIAAHINHQNQEAHERTSLKKNMSISSANLVSSQNANNQTNPININNPTLNLSNTSNSSLSSSNYKKPSVVTTHTNSLLCRQKSTPAPLKLCKTISIGEKIAKPEITDENGSEHLDNAENNSNLTSLQPVIPQPTSAVVDEKDSAIHKFEPILTTSVQTIPSSSSSFLSHKLMDLFHK